MCVLLGVAGAQTQLAGWHATIEADTIRIGEQTMLTIVGAEQYPSTEALSRDGVEALSQLFDTATRAQHTLITSFEPGVHWIRLSNSDSLCLTVLDVEVDTTAAIRDIAGIEQIPYSFWEVFRWVLLGLIVIGVALFIWWMSKHRPQVQQALGLAERPDLRNPYERASDNLTQLREKHLWQSGRLKEYYTELTDIVRRFLEEATGVHATEMTSDETVQAVAHVANAANLRKLFALADLVKFAKSQPLPHQHDEALSLATDLVQEVWQRVKPATEADADQEAAAQHE